MMELEALKATVGLAGPAGLGVSFLTGFFFSFNPVAFAAIPVSLAYVTKAAEARRAAYYAGMFIFGMVAIHVLLGLVAGLGGVWVQQLLGRYWGLLLGPILIVLGLMWPGWIRVKLPALPMRARPVTGPLGAFLLGVPFSVAICPFCTPALVILLGLAATIGSPLYGMALLLVFALGRAVPILIGAIAIGCLESMQFLSRFQKTYEIVGGAVLILSGLYMLNAYFFVFPELAG